MEELGVAPKEEMNSGDRVVPLDPQVKGKKGMCDAAKVTKTFSSLPRTK